MIPPRFGVLSAAAAATTWNSADKAATVALSGGNLTATKSGAAGSADVRGTTSRTTGKWHFEVTVVAVDPARNYPNLGIANAVASLVADLGSDNNSIQLQNNGQIWFGDSNVASTSTFTAGDTIAIEVDVPNQQVFFQRAGSARSGAVSVAGLTGAVFPAVGFYSPTASVTANFGASAFLVTPTAGFLAWG